jgi:hypothetical protein
MSLTRSGRHPTMIMALGSLGRLSRYYCTSGWTLRMWGRELEAEQALRLRPKTGGNRSPQHDFVRSRTTGPQRRRARDEIDLAG